MKYPLIRIAFGVVAFFFCKFPLSFCQQYHFMGYSLEDGLPHSQIEAIFQDKDGYLWIGTLGGLSRFDGRHFINYSTENGLISNQVNDILQDKKGNVWIAVLGGVNKYDGQNFIQYPLETKYKNHNVKSIALDGHDGIWMALGELGLAFFNGHAFQLISIPDTCPSTYARTLYFHKDALYIGTRKGVLSYKAGKFHNAFGAIIKDANVSKISTTTSGHFIIATYGKGVYEINNKQWKNFNTSNGLINDWIRDISLDMNGDYWMASKYGICKIDKNNGEISRFNQDNGLIHSNINVISTDNEGNIWMGADGGGVIKFSGENFVHYTIDDGLSNNIIMSIIQDDEGILWFSTYGNGICRYDGKKFRNFTNKDGIANNTVWTSTKDQTGNLWFGTSGGVTEYLNPGFRNLTVADGLPANKVTALLFDHQNQLWCGTKEGVSLFNGSKFENFSAAGATIGHNVRAIEQSDDGSLWFGSSEGLYHLTNGKLIRYTKDHGLSDNTVYCICKDSDQNLWIGTKNGITFYDNLQFTSIKLSSEISSNFINFILPDHDKLLWIGTNNGVYTIDIQAYVKRHHLKITHYTSQDGIISPECNLNAVYQDASGKIWFGTSEGLVSYVHKNENEKFQNIQPFIHITGIRLFYEKTDWTSIAQKEMHSGLPRNLQLRYNQNHLTFDFTGISLSNPRQVKYIYKLEHFDEQWSPLTAADFATYSNLPFGRYIFKVKASNKNGVWSKHAAEFAFEILPPFWRTWTFYFLNALAIALIAFALFKWRKTVQARREKTRKLIFTSKLLALEHQTLNASMNRHFVFNALNSIQYYINKRDRLSANKYLSSFAKLIRKNLDNSQSNENVLADEIERLQLYLSLEEMRFKGKFEYEFILDEKIDLHNTLIPSMLLQPYVENSIAHGILPMKKKGKVTIGVALDQENKNIIFTISDNGIGIETSKKSKGNTLPNHVSKGMEITKRRIELLSEMSGNPSIKVKGPYEVIASNQSVKGTVVEIILPIKKKPN